MTRLTRFGLAHAVRRGYRIGRSGGLTEQFSQLIRVHLLPRSRERRDLLRIAPTVPGDVALLQIRATVGGRFEPLGAVHEEQFLGPDGGAVEVEDGHAPPQRAHQTPGGNR